MEKKDRGYDLAEIPEFALMPAKPAETKREVEIIGELPATADGGFDGTVYDKLFQELETMKKSYAEEVEKGDRELAIQEAKLAAKGEVGIGAGAEVVESGQLNMAAETEKPGQIHTESKGETVTAVLVQGSVDAALPAEAETESVDATLPAEAKAEIGQEADAEELAPVLQGEVAEELKAAVLMVEKKQSEAAAPEPQAEKQELPLRQAQAVHLIPVDDQAEYSTWEYVGCRMLPEIRTVVEEDLLVPDRKPDLSEIMYIESGCMAEETQFSGGSSGLREIRIHGTVKLQTLYLPLNEETTMQSMDTAVPYRQDLPIAVEPGASVSVKVQVESVEWKILNERKYRVRIKLVFMPVESKTESLNLFRRLPGEDLQMQREKIAVCEKILQKEDVMELSEDLRLPEGREEIGEILCWKLSPVKTSEQVGEGRAVIGGALTCDVLYRSAEGPEQEGTLCWYHGKTEFTQFIRLDGDDVARAAMRSSFCIDSAKLTPAEDDMGAFTRLRLEAELKTDITLYQNRETEVVSDLYHYSRELQYDRDSKAVMGLKGTCQSESSVRAALPLPGTAGDGDRLLFLSAVPRQVTFSAERGEAVAEGSLDVSMICSSGKEGRPYSVSQQIPFRITGEIPGAEAGMVCIGQTALKDIWCDRLGGHLAEIGASLVFSCLLTEKRVCPQIHNLCFVEEQHQETKPSVVVCTVREGESLWGLAKRYRVSPESIRETNQIGRDDRIKAGTKIMIVR